MYRVWSNGQVEDTDPEKIFRLQMDTNRGEDTFSLLKYVGGEPKLFSGMGIDDQGRVFRKNNGWWFGDKRQQRSKSDFYLSDNPTRAFRNWQKRQSDCKALAARLEMTGEYNLPVVAGYDPGTGRGTETIRFKGVDRDLSFKMYFTQVGQRDRFKLFFASAATPPKIKKLFSSSSDSGV
tara:strand:+ start:1037 stop:1573 length:537 start_codon:yes stop_codon:yes gene_type:complete